MTKAKPVTATLTNVNNIRAAIASSTSCTTDTVNDLQTLLYLKPDDNEEKENTNPRRARAATTLTSTRVKQNATTRTRTKTAVTVEVVEDCPSITPKERFALATDVINVALKKLTNDLKPKPPLLRRPSAAKDDSGPTSLHKRSASSPHNASLSSRPTSRAQTALQPKPAGQMPNGGRNTPLRRSSSFSSGLTKGAQPHTLATAECARLAFAYLRSSEARKTAPKDMPPFQVEQGMIAFIGKLIGHGLESVALKELQVLKRRLKSYMGDNEGHQKPAQATIASLLIFEKIDFESAALPLVSSFQLQVLRAAAALKRPRAIEGVSAVVDLEDPISPTNLLLQSTKEAISKDRGARQLEALAQAILTLCPSISPSEDVECKDQSLKPSPESVFHLQRTAFQTRILWWKLAGHKGNPDKELYEPFYKCLQAFTRRSNLAKRKVYELCKTHFTELTNSCDDLPKSSRLSTSSRQDSRATIQKTLSGLAQTAGLFEEALAIVKATPCASSSQETNEDPTTINVASIAIEKALTHGWIEDAYAEISRAIAALGEGISGNSRIAESYLTSVAALRRSATKVFLGKGSPERPDERLERLSFEALSSCVRFLARFLEPKSRGLHSSFSDVRVDSVANMAKGFLDSAIMAAKVMIHKSLVEWEELDLCLQSCQNLKENVLETWPTSSAMSSSSETAPTFEVKMSNVYWASALKTKATSDVLDSPVLKSMKAAVSILLDRSSLEKNVGNFFSKCEKLVELLRIHKQFQEAELYTRAAIDARIQSGTLEKIAAQAARMPLHECWAFTEESTALRKALDTLHRIGLLQDTAKSHDREDLNAISRATLLEYQLFLMCRNARFLVRMEENAKDLLHSIIVSLLSLYSVDLYPVRRQRVKLQLMHTKAEWEALLNPVIIGLISEDSDVDTGEYYQDVDLARYVGHHVQSVTARRQLEEICPSLEALKECLRFWESTLDAVSDTRSIHYSVDDYDSWICLLQAITDFLGVKGHDYVRVSALRILAKAVARNQEHSPDRRVSHLGELAQLYTELGYSGKCGDILAMAETIADDPECGFEAQISLALTYAEYTLSIGNSQKGHAWLQKAEMLLNESDILASLSRPSTPMTTRIQLNRLLARANFVQSSFSLESGSIKAALEYARRCVLLNRRVWVTLENRDKTSSQMRRFDGSDSDTANLTSSLSNMSISSEKPFSISMTHSSLSGAQFWSLAPCIFQGLSQVSKVYEHYGMVQEAHYYLEQAFRVADAVKAGPWIVANLSTRATLYARCGNVEKGQDLLEQAKPFMGDHPVMNATRLYHQAAASLCRAIGDADDELQSLEAADRVLAELSSPGFMWSLYSSTSASHEVEVEPAKSTNAAVPVAAPVSRGTKTGRTRRAPAATSTTTKTPRTTHRKLKTVTNATPHTAVTHTTSSSLENTVVFPSVRGEILGQKALALMSNGDFVDASRLLHQAQPLLNSPSCCISYQLVNAKLLIAQYLKTVETDLTFNGLPESTISFPSVRRVDARRLSGIQETSSPVASPARPVKKAGRGKAVTKLAFLDTLKEAHAILVESQASAVRGGSNTTVEQLCKLASGITVLLSALHIHASDLALHPLQAASLFCHPPNRVLEIEQASIEVDVASTVKEALFRWPALQASNKGPMPSATQFKKQYLDIIPENWSVVSLSLSEDHDELYITRYRYAESSPFILRLPMGRHQSRDLDEEAFTFENGKNELLEIIELSDFSTHDGRNMSEKGAKSEWWAEREALDDRLRDLLLNIENIWLGGFRGIFSQHKRQDELLARFQKSFDNVLNTHLPSRQGRTQPAKVNLDLRILDLFIGLGDPSEHSAEFEEPLMDLVYFVVDVLQLNGERNAYDEVDFDAIVIETLDLLRTYYASSTYETAEQQHTIIVLNKQLHCFPWESLPSLQQLSISRLPSLAALRERILASQVSVTAATGIRAPGYYTSSQGTTILNPSRDLANTQKILSPYLHSLDGQWDHITAQEPVEAEFEAALSEKDLLLYFGHGGGSQYIRQKNVKKLHVQKKRSRATHTESDEQNEQPDGLFDRSACATTWLMGCSSAHIAEHGIYEPTGTILSYMTAGAPAVLGMLWDVTDRDCDRFAVRCGDIWGLWEEKDESAPKRKGRPRAVSRPEVSSKAKGKAKKEKMKMSLDQAVRGSRDACYLRYLNGAAPVVYGIPVWLE